MVRVEQKYRPFVVSLYVSDLGRYPMEQKVEQNYRSKDYKVVVDSVQYLAGGTRTVRLQYCITYKIWKSRNVLNTK